MDFDFLCRRVWVLIFVPNSEKVCDDNDYFLFIFYLNNSKTNLINFELVLTPNPE